MRNNRPKTLEELQSEMELTNDISARVAQFNNNNKQHYSNNKDTGEKEIYYTGYNSFMRQENYTINGEPIGKYRGRL